MITSFAKPGPVRAFAASIWRVAGFLSVICYAAGFYYAFLASPADYQQGNTVRIMYVHVPAAWGALSLYVGMALAALSAFVWKHLVADFFIRAAAPIGAGLSLLCLVTGSLWGKPMWGAWWVWDARLTSMLILFLLYLGVIALRHGFHDAARGAKASQLLLVIGLINIPVVKFSVDWWNTLHQGESVFRAGGPSIHASMLLPLGLMTAALFFFCVTVILLRYLYLTRTDRK